MSLIFSGVYTTSSRQCFSHVWTAVVHPWCTRANIFSCSFTTFSVGEICVFERFRTFSRCKYIYNFFSKTKQKKRKGAGIPQAFSFQRCLWISSDLLRKKSIFVLFFSYLKKLILKLILRRFACFKSQFCDTGQEVLMTLRPFGENHCNF